MCVWWGGKWGNGEMGTGLVWWRRRRRVEGAGGKWKRRKWCIVPTDYADCRKRHAFENLTIGAAAEPRGGEAPLPRVDDRLLDVVILVVSHGALPTFRKSRAQQTVYHKSKKTVECKKEGTKINKKRNL